jgi:hypothetical protein
VASGQDVAEAHRRLWTVDLFVHPDVPEFKREALKLWVGERLGVRWDKANRRQWTLRDLVIAHIAENENHGPRVVKLVKDDDYWTNPTESAAHHGDQESLDGFVAEVHSLFEKHVGATDSKQASKQDATEEGASTQQVK